MFEVIVTACLLAAPDICRDVLLPGHEARTEATCAIKLEGLEPAQDDTLVLSPPRCQPIGTVGKFDEIAPGIYVHRGILSDAAPENYGDVSNMGFIIGQTSVAVIDTGGSRKAGEELYRAIRAHTDLPIDHVILTHMHPDHVLGADAFSQTGARIVGHEKLKRALVDRSAAYLLNFGDLMGRDHFLGTRIALPDTPVQGEMQLDLGGRVIELRTWQTSHSTSDLTVFDPLSGVLFTGDLIFDEHAPALDGSVRGWVQVLDALKEIPAKMIVPGHGGPVLNWPDGAQDLSRYLDVLIKDTKQALDEGQSLRSAAENIAISEADNWALFELFNARNATVAFTELEWE